MNVVSLQLLESSYEAAKEQVNDRLNMKIAQIKFAREGQNLSAAAVSRCNNEEIHVQNVIGLETAADELIQFLTNELSKAIEERDHWQQTADNTHEDFAELGTIWLNQNKAWRHRK